MKAEQYITLGYQRLTTFDVPGGGFSLFGQPPPDRMLTAYGLTEFTDMARVHAVDEALIAHAARWLLDQQKGDGSWENDQGLVHEQSWSNLGNEGLAVTAYITWALTEAGYRDDSGTAAGLGYVREFWHEAETMPGRWPTGQMYPKLYPLSVSGYIDSDSAMCYDGSEASAGKPRVDRGCRGG
jgi:hypothetical protein